VKLVETQYGLHIIQVMDQSAPVKQLQVGTLVKNVIASEETDHSYYVKANEFAGMNNTPEKFNKAIEDQKLTDQTRVALKLGPMDKQVNDLESARQIVNWAYKAEENDVSTVFKLGNKYVVGIVDKVREKGNAPLDEIRADIENKVQQQKKAEMISASILTKKASAKTLEELAGNLRLEVQPVADLRFISNTLGNAGIEPNVVAAACSLEKGIVSEPITGENGVFVLSVSSITNPGETVASGTDLARNYIERNFGARTNYYAFEALKELAKIKDNRREFY
jgi:peptidyl-prolyl cis-trans isomerase D